MKYSVFRQYLVQLVQRCYEGRVSGFSFSWAEYAEATLFLDLTSTRESLV